MCCAIRCGHALWTEDSTDEHHLGRDARRVAGRRRARHLRERVELRPLRTDLLRPQRSVPRGVVDARRDGDRDVPDPPWLPGHRYAVPAPVGSRQHRGHHRHHQRRPADHRPRCRLEPGGVRRARHPPAAAQRADGPVRGGRAGHHRAAVAAAGQLQRTALHLDRRVVRAEADPASASADCDRRQRRAAHAAGRRSVRAALELDACRRRRVAPQVRGPRSPLC